MDERTLSVAWTIDGTLAADKAFYWTLPFGATLLHVSAVGSNDGDATLKIGDADDDDGAMEATAIGDSGTPVEFDLDDFVDTDSLYHYDAADVFTATLDHDGASGTAVDDLQVVFTFLVG